MYRYLYDFDDPDLIRRFENYMKTVNEDVFDVVAPVVTKPMIDVIMKGQSKQVIADATFLYEQAYYPTYKHVYNEDGEIIATNKTMRNSLNYAISIKIFYDLKKKYPTRSWALIIRKIKELKKLLDEVDEYEGSLNVVKYTRGIT